MKKILVLFILLLFAAGCASVQMNAQEPERKTLAYDVYDLIAEYVQEYGEPIVVVRGEHYGVNEKYLEVYWNINEIWYVVMLYYKDGEWRITQDDFARGNI